MTDETNDVSSMLKKVCQLAQIASNTSMADKVYGYRLGKMAMLEKIVARMGHDDIMAIRASNFLFYNGRVVALAREDKNSNSVRESSLGEVRNIKRKVHNHEKDDCRY